jgi:hypothetical protein
VIEVKIKNFPRILKIKIRKPICNWSKPTNFGDKPSRWKRKQSLKRVLFLRFLGTQRIKTGAKAALLNCYTEDEFNEKYKEDIKCYPCIYLPL